MMLQVFFSLEAIVLRPWVKRLRYLKQVIRCLLNKLSSRVNHCSINPPSFQGFNLRRKKKSYFNKAFCLANSTPQWKRERASKTVMWLAFCYMAFHEWAKNLVNLKEAPEHETINEQE